MRQHQSNPGLQLTLCSTDPTAFRANVRAHVNTMAHHGFNAHALGVLASRDISLFLNPPQDLADRYVMLRELFAPWGDALADDLRHTKITSECLPAAALSALVTTGDCSATSDRLAISRLHKLVLSGPVSVLQLTRTRLQEQMATLVAAGLCATGADARRLCMSHNALLAPYRLSWYLERKAAVLEAGGTLHDVRAACCCSASLQTSLPYVLLWQRVKCDPPDSEALAVSCDGWSLPPMARVLHVLGSMASQSCVCVQGRVQHHICVHVLRSE